MKEIYIGKIPPMPLDQFIWTMKVIELMAKVKIKIDVRVLKGIERF
jgi:hypothetical protein